MLGNVVIGGQGPGCPAVTAQEVGGNDRGWGQRSQDRAGPEGESQLRAEPLSCGCGTGCPHWPAADAMGPAGLGWEPGSNGTLFLSSEREEQNWVSCPE